MHKLCVHCDHEKKHEFCMIGYPHNSSNRCQDNTQAESKICTELGKMQGQVKCSSGLGIGSLTLPRGLKQSEWLRLKLPLQTCPVSSKIHLSATSIKQFTKCKFGSFRPAITPLVQLSSPVWIQRLKHNLADKTIGKNSNLNLLSDSIDSNSLLH